MKQFPKVVRVRQRFDTPKLENVPESIRSALAPFAGRVKPGARIAVGVGSRGIRNLTEIVLTVVNTLQEWGADPFIVPAMGSHGGATAEGQRQVLASLGVDEKFLRVPVISSMETVEIGQTAEGVPVYFDRAASAADGIILINRIKPHTDFRAPVESGLIKMLAIGFGKQKGAELVHSYGVWGLQNLIPALAGVILKKVPVLFGLAVLENARDDTAEIIALGAEEMEEREPALLVKAKRLLPKLPVASLDVLVVEKMGKNISGTGIDPNITGRIGIRGQQDEPNPQIYRIVVLNLSAESHGNALGMGLTDIITQRFRDKIDLETTYANVVTTAFLERGFIPLVMPTDREAILTALKTCGRKVAKADARLMVIKSTLDIEEFFISASLLPEIENRPGIEILSEPRELAFDSCGELITDWAGN